jgi:hypothetical protein
MSCARERDILELGTEWVSEARAAELRAHARDCLSCAATLAAVEHARAIARRRTIPALAARERAAIWSSVEGASARAPRWPRFGFAAAIVAGAIVLVAAVAVWERAERDVPGWAVWALSADSALRAGAVVQEGGALEVASADRIVLGAGGPVRAAILRSRPRAAAAIALRATNPSKTAEIALGTPLSSQPFVELRDGDVSFDLARGQPIEVRSAAARIAAIGASFRVAVDGEGTWVAVERGIVQVAGADGVAREVGAGGTLEVLLSARARAASARAGEEPDRVAQRPGLEPPAGAGPREASDSDDVRAGSGGGSRSAAEVDREGPKRVDRERGAPVLKARVRAGLRVSRGASDRGEADAPGERNGRSAVASREPDLGAELARASARAKGDAAAARERGERDRAQADRAEHVRVEAEAIARAEQARAEAEAAARVEPPRAEAALSPRANAEHPARAEAAAPTTPDIPARAGSVAGAQQALSADRAGARPTNAARAAPKSASAQALMRAADALRRQSRLADAARAYRDVASSPDGAALAEESLLRAGIALADLGHTKEALAVLQDARLRFERGELVPERTALEVRLLLRLGRPSEAGERLLALGDGTKSESLELRTRRVETAEALAARDPRSAMTILTPVFETPMPVALHRRADGVRESLRRSAEVRKP